MNVLRKITLGFLLAALILLPMQQIQAGEIGSGSGASSVSLSLNVGETLSVLATPANISFTYSNGVATASGPISVQTSWSLAASRNSLFTYAYFATSTGLTDGNVIIPASKVFASIDGGAAAACSLTSADPNIGAGAGLCPTVYSVPSGIGATTPIGTHTDSVLLSIPAAGALEVGQYNGTLQLMAIAI